MVILLMALESVHILHPPYFFGLNTVGIAHGLKLSLNKPLSSNGIGSSPPHSLEVLIYMLLCSTDFLLVSIRYND
jgi:hypothetical protein